MASQVVLSLQLPFAIAPLLWFTTRRKVLGASAFGPKMAALLWGAAAMVICLNAWVLNRLITP